MLPDVSVVLRDLLAQLLLACSLREHSLISHASLRKQKRTREQEQENKNNSPEDKGDPATQSPGTQAPSQVCKHLCLSVNRLWELRNGFVSGSSRVRAGSRLRWPAERLGLQHSTSRTWPTSLFCLTAGRTRTSPGPSQYGNQ